MSLSLVAYDDSDSETETENTEVPNTSIKQASQPSSSVNCVQYFAPGSLGTKSTYEMQPTGNMDCSGTSTACEDASEHYVQNNNADLTSPYCKRAYSGHTALCMSYKNYEQASSSSTNSGNGVSHKRIHKDSTTAIKGIRPYIPKRLRQENSSMPEKKECDQRENSDCNVKLGISREQTLRKISELIKPYLGSKYKLTEVPKSLIFMSKHSGPVNEIQWCPVREQSHMLLSASMDKTVKVWDAVDTGCCLKTYSCHSCAVRAARWSSCGRRILSGGFDSMLHLTDVETGKQIFSSKNEFRISALKFHPTDSNIFICGGFSPEVKSWDIRTSKVLRVYKAAIQQTLDMLFLPEGKEFLTSTDAVSRDSADRTIIAWDFQSAAKISNQIFHERYTCPSLTLHPKESVFVAQTNGNYMALFSAQRPYRINRKKRYEGHKVEGFAVGCEFSPDGTLLATGSSDGKVFFYNYHTARIIRTLSAHKEACVSTIFHPVLPSLLATCDWAGEVKIWQ
ncbi:WD repeat-containing protein 25 isoform X1 [Pezoporus wallicus]|uniref:WD repeat-containing protein 25 isoform X1 n=1 Tax=Pezoporus wallicus TaxID=35540 RepID=UPI00254DAE80|nr:WD repeat-containing protein 25 isoform X1 [Pezoporus wallicus]XP_061319977.1 WD repeat-containing protein 25 isoform X1 [Pezoporus flaviventris]